MPAAYGNLVVSMDIYGNYGICRTAVAAHSTFVPAMQTPEDFFDCFSVIMVHVLLFPFSRGLNCFLRGSHLQASIATGLGVSPTLS